MDANTTGSIAGHVLVVEDEDDLRELIVELLEREGFAVFAAENGRRALARLESDASRIALVLLDMSMPDVDGWEFLELAKGLAPDALPKVVLMTAHAYRDVESLGAGLHGYLKKPFDVPALLEVVRGATAATPRSGALQHGD